jgi:hypothetical protein
MATYIVFTKESTQDQSELNIYQSKVRKTLECSAVDTRAEDPVDMIHSPGVRAAPVGHGTLSERADRALVSGRSR